MNKNELKQIPWEKLLIWSGFRFKKINENNFSFLGIETNENLRYLKEILRKMNYEKYYRNGVFNPDNELASPEQWLNIIENLHSRAEGGSYDELNIMDTYISGIIRTINEIGLKTHYSCDGHGREKSSIGFYSFEDSKYFAIILELISQDEYTFLNNSFIRCDRKHMERKELLSIAKLLFYNKQVLAQYYRDLKEGQVIHYREFFRVLRKVQRQHRYTRQYYQKSKKLFTYTNGEYFQTTLNNNEINLPILNTHDIIIHMGDKKDLKMRVIDNIPTNEIWYADTKTLIVIRPNHKNYTNDLLSFFQSKIGQIILGFFKHRNTQNNIGLREEILIPCKKQIIILNNTETIIK